MNFSELNFLGWRNLKMPDLFQCDKDLTPIKLSNLSYDEKLARSIEPECVHIRGDVHENEDVEKTYPELKELFQAVSKRINS